MNSSPSSDVLCMVSNTQYYYFFIAPLITNPKEITKSFKGQKVTLQVDFNDPCYTEGIPCQHGGTCYFGENYTLSCTCLPDYGEDHRRKPRYMRRRRPR